MGTPIINILNSRTGPSRYGWDIKLYFNSIKGHEQSIEKEFEKTLRQKVTPVVAGDITLGKIRWRGIYRVVVPSLGLTWLEQRGKIVFVVFNTTPMGYTGTYHGF